MIDDIIYKSYQNIRKIYVTTFLKSESSVIFICVMSAMVIANFYTLIDLIYGKIQWKMTFQFIKNNKIQGIHQIVARGRLETVILCRLCKLCTFIILFTINLQI